MIRLADNLWIGLANERVSDIKNSDIEAILNVAQDLQCVYGWPDVEYMQIGLIDGPGNPATAYYAAVTALATLLKRKRTLVLCHGGSRSLAVVMMYLCVLGEVKWDIRLDILKERINTDLPTMHPIHREMFDSIDWRPIKNIIGK